jgi:hypothetical protein
MAPPNFQDDIRPLFSDTDIEHMLDETDGRRDPPGQLDLGSCQSVQKWAPQILARLRDGSMPPGDPWTQEQIDLFSGWMAAGMPCM